MYYAISLMVIMLCMLATITILRKIKLSMQYFLLFLLFLIGIVPIYKLFQTDEEILAFNMGFWIINSILYFFAYLNERKKEYEKLKKDLFYDENGKYLLNGKTTRFPL